MLLSGASLLLLLSLTLLSAGHRPTPCRAPPLLSGSLSVVSLAPGGGAWAVGRYQYDARGQRIRLFAFGRHGNASIHLDLLFLFRERVVYSIDSRKRSCVRNPLSSAFHPARIPHDASLLAQVLLGGSSSPGEGLLVNTWAGLVAETGGEYVATVTESGCIPVSTLYYTPGGGWISASYFNAVTGM